MRTISPLPELLQREAVAQDNRLGLVCSQYISDRQQDIYSLQYILIVNEVGIHYEVSGE